MMRRHVMKAMLAALFAVALNAMAALPTIEVYKSAMCGCCSKWIDHLRANGFAVNAHDVPSPSDYRQKLGMPQELGSCHSAKVDGYAIEGHVPASEIKRLLTERPKARGLSVPAMPLGAPGMEVEGARSDAYDVLLVKPDGSNAVYRHYDGQPAKTTKAMEVMKAMTVHDAALTDGEIKEVDKAAGTLTIKHGPITNLGMPGMTMTFVAKDAAMLAKLKAGDKVRFAADSVDGAFTVTSIESIESIN